MNHTIYLHIGHSKTGSSFIQSALALSSAALEEKGYAYPIAEAVAAQAKQGKITSGNFWPREGELERVIRSGMASPQKKILISSEAIFDVILRDGHEFLREIERICPGYRLKVLCYLRDPVDHVVSVYQQMIKRGGFTGNLADVLVHYSLPRQTISVLSVLKAAKADIWVLNYSKHKDSILTSVEEWLELSHGSLVKPESEVVNRSLTNAELELQRLFNQHFGEDARRFVSDPLCNSLPSLRSETPPVSKPALEKFIARMKSDMQSLDYLELVPGPERPHLGMIEEYAQRFPAEDGQIPLAFSREQMMIFTTAIIDEIKRLRDRRSA